MAEVINMNQGQGPGGMNMGLDNDSLSTNEPLGHSSPPVEHVPLKAKGHAVPGVDYGLDIFDEPQSGASSPGPGQPGSPTEMSQGSHSMGMGGNNVAYRPGTPDESVDMNMSMGPSMPGMPGMPGMPPPMDMQSNASGGGMFNQNAMSNMMGPPMEQLSYEEIRKRKIDGIAAFRRLKAAGYLPEGEKDVTMVSKLSEIEETVERLTAQRDLDNSIKFQRDMLVGFATITENVCAKEEWNIFELDLEGWSENVFDNISDYDSVFEELHYKYKDQISIPPELKLVGMVAGSAYMYHMSRDVFDKSSSKVPEFNEVMARNPHLKREYQDAAAQLARERGLPVKKRGNNPGLYGILSGQGVPSPMQQRQMQPVPEQLPNMPPPQMPQQQSRMPPQQQQQQQQPHQRPKRGKNSHVPPIPKTRKHNRIPMDDPDDVDGLLGSLTGMDNGNGMYDDEIDLSELENYSDLA